MPFTTEQLFNLFAAYNQAIWPAQALAYTFTILALAAMFARLAGGHRMILGLLGLFWLWNGIGYHLVYFTRINAAAYGFAALFVVQGILFLMVGAKLADAAAPVRWGARTIIGAALIGYAMVLYAILGARSGHAWPRNPVFGVAPCPTTIFTFGVLMLLPQRLPAWLLVVPLIWAAIGSTAAILLAVPEDLGLLAAGLIGAGWLLLRARTPGAEIVAAGR